MRIIALTETNLTKPPPPWTEKSKNSYTVFDEAVRRVLISTVKSIVETSFSTHNMCI